MPKNYLLLGTLCFVHSISAYLVLNDTLPGYDTSVETTSYKHNFYNHHYNMLSKEEYDDPEDAITKSYPKGEGPKIVPYEPKTTADLREVLIKNGVNPSENRVDSVLPKDVLSGLSKENGQLFNKYKNGIPYYVTKNDDILGAGDLGTLPNVGQFNGMAPLPNSGNLPNMGNLGGEKLNFTLGNYMKLLTKNSSLTTADVYKYVFSKKCLKEYNMVCLKLDLIKILSNINNDNNRSISIIPHLMSISMNNNMTPSNPMSSSIPDQDAAADDSAQYASLLTQKLSDNRDFVENKELYESMVLRNNYNTNYYINNILKRKIIGLLNNMTLNFKLFDNTTIGIIRKLVHGYGGNGGDAKPEGEQFDGRGRKRQKNMIMHAIASAAMMSGGTLLVLGLKTLAAMATKALIASLIALVLTCFSSFGGGGHKGDLKSTTYEIITKPVLSHAHLHTSEVQHAEPSSVGYNTYARSGPDPYRIDPLDVLPLQQAILSDKSNDKHIIHVNPMFAESRELLVEESNS